MEEDIQPSLGRGMTARTDGAEGGTRRTDARDECQHSRGGGLPSAWPWGKFTLEAST